VADPEDDDNKSPRAAGLPDDDDDSSLVARSPDELRQQTEPPVVARLVVEIRSDGSRTIARGALEDAQRGDRVAIEARGDSPIQLAMALARALTRLPLDMVRGKTGALGTGDTPPRRGVRGLLGRRRNK
jgi:hypothetical protein